MKLGLIIAALAASLSGAVQARETIRLIVPYAAGGPTDQVARILAPKLADALDANVVVEPRTGAGGTLGSLAVATAAPDGNTLLFASSGSQVLAPLSQAKPSYDPVKSFTPIALIGNLPSVLIVNKALGVGSLDELVALAKKKHLNYGSSGIGNSPHLAGELLNSAFGLSMTHVPYRGAGPAITDIVAGNIDLMVADLPVVQGFVAEKQVTALVVFGPQRTPLLPELPSTAELGHPDLALSNWYAVFAPAGISEPLQAKLEKAVAKTLASPEFKNRLTGLGIYGSGDGRALAEKLAADLARWKPIIDRLGIRME